MKRLTLPGIFPDKTSRRVSPNLLNPPLSLEGQKHLTKKIRLGLALAVVACLQSLPPIFADNAWDGGGASGNWSDLTNWGGNTTPVSPTGLTFGGTLQFNSNNDLFAPATPFNGLTFSVGAGAFVISGSSLNLGGNVANNSTSLQTINLDLAMTAARTFTTSAGGGNITLGGVVSGGFNFVKAGLGTLTLNGSSANTYTGQTQITGGTLLVDFANMATPTNLIDPASTLQLGGGVLSIKGANSATPTSQTMGNVTQNGTTYSKIVIDANGGSGGTTLALGTLSHTNGSTALIDISSAGSGATTTSAVTNGLLNASYLIKDATGTGFATKSGSNIVRYDDTTGTTLAGGALTNTVNYTTLNSVYTSGTLTLASGNQSLNSLAIDTTNSGGTINLNGGIKTVTSTGVLFRGTNNAIITNGQLGANNSEVIVHHLGSGQLTLSGTISGGSGRLTKDGSGELIVNGVTAFTNGLSVLDGTLTFNSSLSAGTVVVGGVVGTVGTAPTLNLGSTNAMTAGTLSILNSNAVVNINATNAVAAGVTRNLTAGELNVNAAQSWNTAMTINSGFTLGIGDNGALGTSTLVLGGGTIRSNNSAHTINNAFEQGNANSTIAGTQDLTFNGLFTNKGSATLTISNAGLTTFAGGITLRDAGTAQRSLTLNGTGSTVISGAIINGASLNGIMDFKGSGVTTMSGNNSYSGVTTIGGVVGGNNVTTTVKLGSSTALGFGGASAVVGTTTVNTGATLDLGGQTGVVEGITINGSGVGGLGALINSSTSTGAVIDTGFAAVGIGTAGSGYTDGTHALTISGGGGTGAAGTATVVGGVVTSVQVTNAGTGYTANPTVTFVGAGVPVTTATFNTSISTVGVGTPSTIGGAGDITVNTTITGAAITKEGLGTLLINGSAANAITVNAGVLGGTGSIANTVSLGGSGTLAPGNSPGTLNTGALSLTGTAATIAMEISGTAAGQYDQVNVTGAVNLNGNGRIEMTLLAFVPAPTDVFFLVLNDGADAINGTLFGLNQGDQFTSGGYTWQVSYTGNSATNSFTGGNDLALQVVVPEPATLGFVLLGGIGLVSLRRRR